MKVKCQICEECCKINKNNKHKPLKQNIYNYRIGQYGQHMDFQKKALYM
jgi:hypothetical protein